jgi:hypothetical protein
MSNIQEKIAFHEEQIRKLRELGNLLSDPQIAATARELLLKSTVINVSVEATAEPRVERRPRRQAGRKRNLKKKALEIVRESAHLLTAREISEIMALDGFTFRAKNKKVAVSKALRSLADEKEIVSHRGEKDKSAIKYGRLPSLLNLPVQETTH